MRAQTVDVRESAGRVLSSTIFRPGGRKLLAKGHVINPDDVKMLATEGMEQVSVTELEEGEIGEDEAVSKVAGEMACGCAEIRLANGGRANLIALENCSVLVDDELLKQINCTSSVVIATALNFSYARAGMRIATIKSAPFAVTAAQLEATISILRERGPILQARPVRNPAVAVLYTDPIDGERARVLFEPTVVQRLERYGTVVHQSMSAVEDEDSVTRAIRQLLKTQPTVILIASTTAPAGPHDVIGRAMARANCHIERFLAPVEPGSLMLLGYHNETPLISAPGCFRSVKTNVVDLVLPPMLARYRMSGWELAALGHGGLLV